MATFAGAVTDPVLNAAFCLSSPIRARLPPGVRKARLEIASRAMARGLDALDARDRSALLEDPGALARLHVAAWSAPPNTRAR